MVVVIHSSIEAMQNQFPEAYDRWAERCAVWGLPSPLPRYGDIWIEDGIIREMYECDKEDCRNGKVRRMMSCQVCGRNIKASKGLIAHHGYRRPYDGWQTASCQGARYVPYEESCERLKEIAVVVQDFISLQEESLTDFLSNPPENLTVLERKSSYSKGVERIYGRPSDFQQDNKFRSQMPRTYENVYSCRVSSIEEKIKMAKADLEEMKERIVRWKEPMSIL